MIRTNQLFELFVIAAIAFGVRTTSAEPLGTIEGTIAATTGSAITGATVSVDGVGVHRATTTDDSGHFAVGGLVAGTYSGTAFARGFSGAAASIKLAAGATSAMKLLLAAKPIMPFKDPEPPPPAKPMAHHAPSPSVAAPSPPALAMEQDPAMNTETYAKIDDNPFFQTQARPLSTFSADVDTASYSNTRRFLRDGKRPPLDAVRVEEMLNYFHYSYPSPPK